MPSHRYGIDACVEMVLDIIGTFDLKGVPLRYFEFGNELFGWWAAPYDYDGFRWDGRDYGVAFSSVRRKVKDSHPTRGFSFGLVVNDDKLGECHGSHSNRRVGFQPTRCAQKTCVWMCTKDLRRTLMYVPPHCLDSM